MLLLYNNICKFKANTTSYLKLWIYLEDFPKTLLRSRYATFYFCWKDAHQIEQVQIFSDNSRLHDKHLTDRLQLYNYNKFLTFSMHVIYYSVVEDLQHTLLCMWYQEIISSRIARKSSINISSVLFVSDDIYIYILYIVLRYSMLWYISLCI